MLPTPLVRDGAIRLSGYPGQHGVDGLEGQHGYRGADAPHGSQNPGQSGGPGGPGTHATPGTDGTHAGSIAVTLERASDSELKVICGEYSEVAKYPFSIYASGGKGGAGGDGGRGGRGGDGGNGTFWMSEPEHRKYQVKVTQYSRLTEEVPIGGAQVGYQPGTSAQVGYQASSSAQRGYQASPGPVQTETRIKQGYAGVNQSHPDRRSKSKTFSHKSFNDLVESSIRKDLRGLKNRQRWGSWHQSSQIQIQDWDGINCYVEIVYGPQFKVMPTAMRSPYTTSTLQYTDHDDKPCEITIVETIIPPIYTSTNGGTGGDGGPGGMGANGGHGGDAGHITVSSQDAVLLAQVDSTAYVGSGGKAGVHGDGGQGGAGGRPGSTGSGGKTGSSGRTPARQSGSMAYGRDGKAGSVTYIRLGPNGEVLQQGPCGPYLKATEMLLTMRNASLIWEKGEPVVFDGTITNTGTISMPPNSIITIPSTRGVQLLNATYTHPDWIEPGASIEVAFEGFVTQELNKTVAVDIRGKLDRAVVMSTSQSYGHIAYPIELCKNTVPTRTTASLGDIFDIGGVIRNLSGIPTGCMHGRDVIVTIDLEDGLEFVNDDPFPSQTPVSCRIDVQELPLGNNDMMLTKHVRLISGLKNFQEVKWSVRAHYRADELGIQTFSVKYIPRFTAAAAEGTQVLLATHSGLKTQPYEDVVSVCAEYGLRCATWDYTFQPEFKVGRLFAGKMIICFPADRQNKAPGPFTATDIFQHFYEMDKGPDSDSSFLLLSASYDASINHLRRMLSVPILTATDEQLKRNYFGDPTMEDFEEVIGEIMKPILPEYPHNAIWPEHAFTPKNVDKGIRSTWLLGALDVHRSTVSLFDRIYVTSNAMLTRSRDLKTSDWVGFATAIRSAMTTSQKLAHIAQADEAQAEQTESALYYDLKTEFFFHPRPLLFFRRVLEAVTTSPALMTNPRAVEATLRIFHRILNAAYWKSFGFSPLKPRYYEVEEGISTLKRKLTGTPGLDLKAIQKMAKAGAKKDDRVKWRKQGSYLPHRLADTDLENASNLTKRPHY